MTDDVPSPIDFRSMTDAEHWSVTVEQKRPWRTQFYAAFAEAIRAGQSIERVLELGSGPGFLAQRLLAAHPRIDYVALDFSAAMHELARARLGDLARRVSFVERSFKDAEWSQGMGSFDCVVTLQAVHELRHKRHAEALHTQVREILTGSGVYLVCDHFAGDGGMPNAELFMTVDEQREALRRAGFDRVEPVLVAGTLAMLRAVSGLPAELPNR